MSIIAGKIKGITIEIAGDTQPLNKALKDVNKSSQDIQKELRQVERLLKFNPGNTELLAQKQKLLGEQVATTREKLDRLKMAQAQVEEQFRTGKIGEEQYRAFQRELVETESKLKHFEKQLASTKKGLDDYGKAMTDAGKKMTDAGKNLSMKVTAPIVGLGAVIAKTGMDFEAGMSEVGAISGATGKDLQALESLAKEMGATTKFSASDAADGLKFMAMAGWDTQQMMDGLPGVLNLAAASGEDLGKVSDIVTDAMTAFGMEAAQAGEFADTLAAAASNSNTNVGMLGESFKYVAPVAGALGYEAKDTATALGLMANAGIKSSQAGSALRTILTNMAKPTAQMQVAMDKYGISLTNADGSMKSLDEVMFNLRDSLGGLTEAEQAAAAATIFGKEAMSGALAIVNTSEADYNKLSESINNSTGAAERMSKEMQDNLQGRLTELKSAIEGAALQLYDAMLPALEKIVAMVQKAVGWFADLSPGVKSTIVVIAGLVAAIGPLLLVFGPLISTLGTMITGLGAMSAAMASGATVVAGLSAGFPALGAVVTIATGPIGLAVAAIAGLTAGGIALYKHLSQESIPAIELFGDEVSESTKKAVGGFLELNDEATLALNQLSWSGQEVTKEMADGITENFSQMAADIQAGLDKHHGESLAKIEGFVNNSTSLSKEEQDEILNNMQQGYEDRKQEVSEGEARIKEILDTASTEKRALTKAEQEEINAIQKQMVETGIQVLSENEIEAKAIMERMKAQAGEITALQAAEVVKNSLEQRDGAVKAANEQYNDVVKEIIRQRDETGAISVEQADKLILEATRQKDDTVAKAEEMHQRVVEEAKAQAKEHINQVDWETGEIKTKWQIMKADISQKAKDIKENVAQKWEEIKEKTAEEWTGIWEDTKRAWNDVKTEIADCTRGALDAAIESWINLKKTTVEKWDEIKTAIGNTLTDIISGIIQSGKDMVTGLWDGMNEKIGWLKDKLRSFVSDVISTIKGALGIKSPSREMAAVGEAIVQGLAVGITKDAGAPATALASIGAGLASLAKGMASSVVKGFAAGSGDFHVAAMGDPSTWPVSDTVMFVQPDGSKLPSVVSGTGVHMDPGQMDKYQDNWDSYIRSGAGGGGGSSGGSSYDSGGNYTGSEGTGTGQYTGGYEVVDHGDYYDVPGIGKVPKKAKGGILTAPQFVFAGEAGHEALLPLEELQPMMAQALVQATSSMQTALSIDYDKLGAAVAKHSKPSIDQINNFYSPEALTPSETARQNLKVSRKLAMEWGL